MNKNRIVVITGMAGVGKDFLADKAIEGLSINKIGWGDMLSDELGVNKDIMMNTVTPEKILDGQFAVCRKVIKMQPLIAICHVVRLENNRYKYYMEIEKLLNPVGYVFITAPAELIAQRVHTRNLKGKRKVSEVSTKDIERIQNIKLQAVQELASLQNSELLILNNVAEEIEPNIVKLRSLLINTCHV